MADTIDRIQNDFAQPFRRMDLASNLLDGVKSLPQQSLDIAPLDPVSAMTRDLNFPNASVHDGSTAFPPEQLDTSRRLGNQVVADHLQKIAGHFENYANKLLKAVTPANSHHGASKDGTGTDNLTKHNCPFVRVANAVGLKYPSSSNSGAGKGGTA